MDLLPRTPGGRRRAVATHAEVARLHAEVTSLRRALAATHRELEVERYAARHDALTGLPNRYEFYRRAGEIFDVAASGPVIAMLLDLNGFKRVNDMFGHAAGDVVLVVAAQRLASLTGAGWLPARLGGDEFVCLRAASDDEDVMAQARSLASALDVPMEVTGHALQVGAAIGVAAAERLVTIDGLLHRADLALYRSKRIGRPVMWTATMSDCQRS